MSGKVAELQMVLGEDSRENLAVSISNMYDEYNQLRTSWVAEKTELRNYIFATDTTKTTNAQLPWKNKTTLPKLCQIRDNLHANYMSALFPNDNWMRWEGYNESDATAQKKQAIEAYLSNKTREGGFRETVSQLLYDYIDYGNAFADVVYVNESVTDETGETIQGYVGPKVVRISPLDIIFNPTASSFDESPKITRYVKTIGEILSDLDDMPELDYDKNVLDEIINIRKNLSTYEAADINKAAGYRVDGFGDLATYYQSNYVELLEFEGSIYDFDSNTLLKNQIITIIDRRKVLRKKQNPSWMGKSYKTHVGWRTRPDNLYGMGPLDNLVGMQYRIDHLENLKADVFDLIAHPPLKIKGDVEEFEWEPNAEIFLGDDGDVEMLKPDTTALNADMQIEQLQQKMEELAGAPKQAMGIRTPGEKTAFEVQTLDNASSRIFQEKINHFEIMLLEPVLNRMLELSKRRLDATDVARVIDDDLGVEDFLNITKEDITARGNIRPIGSRHFAARAQLIQNLQSLLGGALGQAVAPHTSGKALSELLEELLQLERFKLFKFGIGVTEQQEVQRLAQAGAENVGTEGQVSLEEGAPNPAGQPSQEELMAMMAQAQGGGGQPPAVG